MDRNLGHVLRKLRIRGRLGKSLYHAHTGQVSLHDPQQGLRNSGRMYSLLKAKKK